MPLVGNEPQPEDLSIAVRAYAEPVKQKAPWAGNGGRLGPSGFTLTFDTETFSDAVQQFRVGAYQWREDGLLLEAGLFYDRLSLEEDELSVLLDYKDEHGLVLHTDRTFVDEVGFGLAYQRGATIVGFNLPFDISRLAIDHQSARGSMRGGFTFRMSEDEDWPNIRVRHLSSSSALIGFAARRKQRSPRSFRKKGKEVPVWRGYFADVKTAGDALLGGSHSLRSLAELLDTPTKKLDMDDYAGSITREFLDYATTDVQVTAECYHALAARYQGYRLSKTHFPQIYSEASIGKACLKEMSVARWRKLQPDFPKDLLGVIMSTYYGGRSEVRIRRQVTRVLYCDFLSMYPTVCSLMGLWPFVTAQGIDHVDATEETRALVRSVSVEDLQRLELWKGLSVLLQVAPDADLFPVRSKYGAEGSYVIGLNYLTSERPLWFTLADVIASKVLTGKPPAILRAIRFEPQNRQPDLQAIDLMGRSDFHIDPEHDDLYRRLIDLRTDVREAQRQAEARGDMAMAERLEAEQQALKVTANATSYGIFVELNVDAYEKLRELTCQGIEERPFPTWEHNVEKPGNFFHPLVATLITGGARLMLALAEHQAGARGIGWVLADTDSMALACPDGMDGKDFLAQAEAVRSWFTPLNPYAKKGPIFRVEGANYRVVRGKVTDDLEPLFVFAVSAKRYCLFNIDGRNRPIIRKASAHGLGHLRAPYDKDRAPRSIPKPLVSLKDLEVERWEYDLWYRIVLAAVEGHPEQVKTSDLAGLDAPAVSRYAATTPALLSWFGRYNRIAPRRKKPYREQVRPFGFLLAFQADPLKSEDGVLPRVVAPFDRDPQAGAARCFDRQTGEPVDPGMLMTYRRALAQYHMHPEAKFSGADYTDAGETRRRHVRAFGIDHIGKEANRWEERLYLGEDPEAQISYGRGLEQEARLRDEVLRACQPFGVMEIATEADRPHSVISGFLKGKKVEHGTLIALQQAIPRLEERRRAEEEWANRLVEAAALRAADEGLTRLAERLTMDASNLRKVLDRRRRASQKLLRRIEGALDGQTRR